MPRIGRHPLKSKDIRDDPIVHQGVTVTTIVYIPMLSGYWQNSLEVLKLFFQSLYASTDQSFDLMVFDNGSCDEVLDYLHELHRSGKIQYLILSEQNLRKLGALNFLLSAAPGEYIAYADSDVYFLPGWLEQSIEILRAFPNSGKVTALPLAGGDRTRGLTLLDNKTTSIQVEIGSLIPDEYIEAHRLSLGITAEEYSRRLIDRKDVMLTADQIRAYICTADFQFLITHEASRAALPLIVENPDEYYDPIYSPVLEKRLDTAGYLQLSTCDYLIHHMGNQVPDFSKEIPWMKWETQKNTFSEEKKRKNKRFWNKTIIRRCLRWLNTKTYQLLYE